MTFHLLSYLSSPNLLYLQEGESRDHTASSSDWTLVLCRSGLSAIILCFRHGVKLSASARSY